MNFFDKIKQQKFLPFTLLTVTLCTGIVIGTVMNTGVHAAKGDTSPAPDATPLAVASPTKVENEFAKLAKRVEPSVVNISTDYQPKTQTTRRGRPSQGDEEDIPDDQMEMFRRFFGGMPGQGQNMPPPKRFGTGTGFVVDANGYIMTNYHVVDKADHIKVKLPNDRTEYKAKLIGFDRETDLAVIKIDANRKLPVLKIGNADAVEVGDWAVAVGSPFGLDTTVTVGIVSAKGRDRSKVAGAQQFQSFIQTDAAINPGNSGGPLLNSRGEVIGINTAIATATGGYQGIGFALPINTAVKSYNQIIKTGRVSRGSIGIQFSSSDQPELLKALGVDGGVVVSSTQPGGPAEKAGIKEEDIIVAMNGQPVKNGSDLIDRVADTPVGEALKVTVDRGGKKMDFNVTIGDREKVFSDREDIAGVRDPDAPASPEGASQAKFGIAITNLGEGERKQLGLEDKQGVQVTEVNPDSFAEEIGVRPRDIITSINRHPVASVDDVKRIQATLKPGDPVAFRIMRATPQMGRRGAAPEWNTFFAAGTLPSN